MHEYVLPFLCLSTEAGVNGVLPKADIAGICCKIAFLEKEGKTMFIIMIINV